MQKRWETFGGLPRAKALSIKYELLPNFNIRSEGKQGNYGNNNGSYGNNGNYDNNNGYNQAMNDRDFSQLLQKIRGQWFGKINTAKEGINENYFTTLQVRQILQLFSSENDKLELAKLAYRNTVDQRNYAQLYDVFSYQSSRDELDQYIRNNRW